jgi:predicted aldo/keto reductase-like oxidoreductase
MDCDHCGKCEGVCPNKFPIQSLLEKYDATYREARYRDVIAFGKTRR